VAVVGVLVAAAIISVGISESYFSYEDSKAALTEAEADKDGDADNGEDRRLQDAAPRSAHASPCLSRRPSAAL
jgi:hypothetical protein